MDLTTYLNLLRLGNQVESSNPTATLQFLIQAQTELQNNKFLPINIQIHEQIITQRINYLKKVATKIKPSSKNTQTAAVSLKSPLLSPTQNLSAFKPPSIQTSTAPIQTDIALVLMQWDERAGPQRISAYPPNTKINLADFMQIYANHLAENDRGMLSMDVRHKSFTSYYSGPEKNLFMILICSEGLDVDKYEIKMESVMNSIENYKGLLEISEKDAHNYYKQIVNSF